MSKLSRGSHLRRSKETPTDVDSSSTAFRSGAVQMVIDTQQPRTRHDRLMNWQRLIIIDSYAAFLQEKGKGAGAISKRFLTNG